MAYNDAHEQITYFIYQYQEYLSRNGGILPPSVVDDMNQDVNLMNFASTDAGVFLMEIRSTKRPLVFSVPEKNVEPQKSPGSMGPRRQDVAFDSKEKAPLKKTFTYKILVSKAKQMAKPYEADDQNIQKLRFPSLTRHQRKDDT